MKFDKSLKKKLLKKLNSYINTEAEQLQHEDEGLSKVLKKLKKKEKHLKELVAAETDVDEREMLEQELKIVHSQRKKGIKLLSSLRKTGSSK
jgi:predicted  nucleic acid-binding Zn-ribbon protein